MTSAADTIHGILTGRLRFRDVKDIDCRTIEDERHKDILSSMLAAMETGRRPTVELVSKVTRMVAASKGYDGAPAVAELERIARGDG